jgi:hypothetical protein
VPRPLTQRQLATRRRVESVIRVMAPALDVVLFAGEQLSKAVSRNELPSAPERQAVRQSARTRIGGPPSS